MESLKHSKGTRRRTKLGKIGSPLDHKLKQGKWGEIKLGELFEIKTTKGVNIDRLTVGDNYDYVTRTSKEQGILQKTGSIPGLPANAKNSISLGLLQMDFFVRERPWYAGQFVREIVPKLEMNRNSLLFFATILNKQKKRFLNVLVRDVDSLFSDTAVKLPLLEDGSVDFERIDFLIRELEEERIRELEAYLKAAGLNNTELTSAEKQAINAITNPSRGGGEFKIGDLFQATKGDVDIQQRDINGRGTYFIHSGQQGMGIKGKTDRLAKVFPANTITIDLWGLAYYRPFEYKMATHNDVFSISGNIIKNEKVGLYLVSTMRYLRNIFNFNKKGTWTRIKEYGIKLPVDENGDIDYEFMENLTAAMMKLCIAKLKEKMKREHETYKKAVAGA